MIHFLPSKVRFTLLAFAALASLLPACSDEGSTSNFPGGVGSTSSSTSGSTTDGSFTGTGGGGPGSGGNPGGVVGSGGAGAGAAGNSGGGPGGVGSGGMAASSICLTGDPNTMSGELIDNMEALSGSWFASNDGMTQQTPEGLLTRAGGGLAAPGAAGTEHALHTTANVPDNTEWGATVNLDLPATANPSQWTGVRFWVKGSGSPRLNLVTKGTLPPDAGGTCNGTCYDSHGLRISLGADWTQIKVPFDGLRQEGFGTEVGFSPSDLVAIALQIKSPGSYDIWLDELEFYAEEGMPDCANYPGDSRCEPTDAYCAECSQDPRCDCLINECVETGVLEGPLACNQQMLSQRQGGSTRYWINQMSSDRDTSGGYEALACGFPVISKGSDQGSAASQDKVVGAPNGGTFFGALNSTDFGENAALCGACVLVNNSVTIQIVDECPNRPGAQSNPSCVSGHIDLSVAAANQVGGDNPGISWKVVPCENASPAYFWHWDTNAFWGALSIAGLRYPAAKVELKDGDAWLEGKRKPYWGAWIFGKDEDIPGSSGQVPPPPWTVRITDIHGQVLQDKFTSQSGGYANPVQNGTAVPYPSLGMIQLPICM